MENTVKVSIIVPVYRTERYIQQCVDSLLSQTYSNLEIILVDDASPDNCGRICDSYSEQDSRVRVIHKENEGASFARASGLSSAVGDYVMFVDSDDWLEPDTVKKCVAAALRDNADCVMHGYIKEYPNASIPNYLFDSDFSYDVHMSEELVHRRIVGRRGKELSHPEKIDSLSSVCMRLYRMDTARKGRGISERMIGSGEDMIFNLYALDDCRISYINECLYHYRKTNAQSITTQYKADLAEKWDVMYQIMQEYIDGSGRAEVYQPAFLNRVACGMIGLGLNEISSSAEILEKSRRLKLILEKELYTKAFAQLDISPCPLKWKVFFLLCKWKTTLPLAVLLSIINHLRSRVAA